MRIRGMKRAGVVGALAVVGASGAPAQATVLQPWIVHDRPGSYSVSVPPGATAIEAVAVGGHGGGTAGGRGAVVSGSFPVMGGQRVTFHVAAPVDPFTDIFYPPDWANAGAGGNASFASVCDPAPARCIPLLRRVLVAAGGGGSGAGNGGFAAPGGDAGQPGAAGRTHTQPATAAGGGGSAGTDASGGAGGSAGQIPDGCVGHSGATGLNGSSISGGAGGPVAGELMLPPGGKDVRSAGGGGDGLRGGGGGGSGASCDGLPAGGGGGGGGGASLVPAGGTFAINEGPGGQTSVRYSIAMEQAAPTIAIVSPAQSAVYERGAVVAASYSCADEGGSGLASCTGTLASGAPIDTASAGVKTFTVTAADRAGNATSTSVRYEVREPAAPPAEPRLSRLSANAAAVRFTLSAPARIAVRIERRTLGGRSGRRRAVRWVGVRTLRSAGRAGANRVGLPSRGRGALRPGTYRVTVEATANGRTARVTSRTFGVKASRARGGRRTVRGRARRGAARRG